MRQELDRMFPGLSNESHEQATCAASYGGIGWRSASHIARSACLSAMVLGAPKVAHMAAAACLAGLLILGQFEQHLAVRTDRLALSLDEQERGKALGFLVKATAAAR